MNEQTDDRFVKICNILKERNTLKLEQVFSHLEKNEITEAREILNELKDLDAFYRISMSEGMKIIERNKKDELEGRTTSTH